MRAFSPVAKEKTITNIEEELTRGTSLREACKKHHIDPRTYKKYKHKTVISNPTKQNTAPNKHNNKNDDNKSERILITLTKEDTDKLKKIAKTNGIRYSTLAKSLLHISIQQLPITTPYITSAKDKEKKEE